MTTVFSAHRRKKRGMNWSHTASHQGRHFLEGILSCHLSIVSFDLLLASIHAPPQSLKFCHLASLGWGRKSTNGDINLINCWASFVQKPSSTQVFPSWTRGGRVECAAKYIEMFLQDLFYRESIFPTGKRALVQIICCESCVHFILHHSLLESTTLVFENGHTP